MSYPEENQPNAAKPVSKSILALHQSLHAYAQELGLTEFDVREADRILRYSEDEEQVYSRLQELIQKLDPFDTKDEKVSIVYAKLAAQIRHRFEELSAIATISDPSTIMVLNAPTTAQSAFNVSSDWYRGIDALLSGIRAAISGRPEETFSFANQLTTVEDLIRKQADWSAVEYAIEMALDQTRKIELYLQGLRDGAECEYRRDSSLGATFYTLLSQLRAELEAGSSVGLRRWLQSYAFCLSEWQLDRCLQMADKDIGLPDLMSLVYSEASKSLAEGRYGALEIDGMLEHLINKVQPDPIVDRLTLAKLLVLRGRVNLYHLKHPGDAKDLFEIAQRECPNHGLPVAAMGEYYLNQSQSTFEYAEAENRFRKSVQLSPNLADAYLGMGRLHEQRKLWEQAKKWYDLAADVVLNDSDAVISIGKLLAPVSGVAYSCLAFKLVADQPEAALRAVARALDIGIRGKDKSPQAEALRLKGNILLKLGRIEDAVKAFSESGQHFSSRDSHEDIEQARESFENALRLDPNKISNYWHLSNVCLMLCRHAAENETKCQHIEYGIKVWNDGVLKALPDTTLYWAYAVRADLAVQQAALLRGENWSRRIDLWWQSVVMMERLLLINDWRTVDWSFLARSLDSLILQQNALAVSERAFEFDKSTPFIADRYIFALCNLGRFDEAVEAIEHRFRLKDDPSVYWILAWVKVNQGRYEEARASIEHANTHIEQEKQPIWLLTLRGFIYEMANDTERASQDWEVIDMRLDKNDIGSLGAYADAAFGLGRRDEAIQLLKTPVLLNDPLERDGTLRSLGLFQLLSGQHDEGWKNVEEGIALSRQIPSLSLYLAECKEKLNSEDADRVGSLVQAKTSTLRQPKTLEQELFEAYNTFGALENDRTWTRIGIQASLARVFREKGRWLEAEKIYDQLRTLGPISGDDISPFPEAQQGLDLCKQNSTTSEQDRPVGAAERGMAREFMRRILMPESDDSPNLKFVEDWEVQSESFFDYAITRYDKDTVTALLAILVNASKALADQVELDPSSPIRDIAKPLFDYIKVAALKYSPTLREAVEIKRRERNEALY